MKSASQWLDEIHERINDLKPKGIHAYYAFSAEMNQKTVKEIQLEFTAVEGYYNVEVKSCKCKKKTFDVIIQWR